MLEIAVLSDSFDASAAAASKSLDSRITSPCPRQPAILPLLPVLGQTL